MSDWSKVTREDVIKAIEKFNKEKQSYAKSRTTYLIYDNIVYPGKQIRRMAYDIAFGVEPSHFYGGKNTIDFYENLGFDTYWTERDEEIPEYEVQIMKANGKIIEKCEICHLNNIETDELLLKKGSKREQSIKISTHYMGQQKKYIQNLLYELFGEVEIEKRFSWATTPREESIYMNIIANIEKISGTRSFAYKKHKLAFDFVCEKKKLLIEYDERQHFSEQRKIALLSYPSDLYLNFDKKKWIKACDDINAKMKKKNSPFRDETRAFYDSVRDIEACRHGYKLIRIMHGQFDFSREDAKKYLLELIGD